MLLGAVDPSRILWSVPSGARVDHRRTTARAADI